MQPVRYWLAIAAVAALLASAIVVQFSVAPHGYLDAGMHRLFLLQVAAITTRFLAIAVAVTAAGGLLWSVARGAGWPVGRSVGLVSIPLGVAIGAAAADVLLQRFVGVSAYDIVQVGYERLAGETVEHQLVSNVVEKKRLLVTAGIGAVATVLVATVFSRALSRVPAGFWPRFMKATATPVAILAGVMLAVTLAAAIAVRTIDRPATGPNIVVVCVDALRADALGCYGYAEPTTPFIDEFAASGRLYENAFSHSSWTKTSVATLFSGQLDVVTRVSEVHHKLPAGIHTLAEKLRNAGYRTSGLVANPWLQPSFGFAQGFEHYDDSSVSSARLAVEDAIAQFAAESQRPLFMYMHFMDVHNPYRAPAPYTDMFAKKPGRYVYFNGAADTVTAETVAYTRARYDGELRYFDEKFKQLVEAIRDRDMMDNTVIILCADHGDEFKEHGGLGHGTTLYPELLRVPLIIWAPGIDAVTPGRVVDEVSVMDVFATVLALANVDPGENPDSRNLLGTPAAQYTTVSGVVRVDTGERLLSLTDQRYALIHSVDRNRGALYDRVADPEYHHDLADSLPAVYTQMETDLLKWVAGWARSGHEAGAIDKKTMEKLKALGYL